MALFNTSSISQKINNNNQENEVWTTKNIALQVQHLKNKVTTYPTKTIHNNPCENTNIDLDLIRPKP